jgi:hypothetical protein
VLEINPGGNTWHFSSPWATAFEKERGGRKLKDQLGAFDIAARVLIEKTRTGGQMIVSCAGSTHESPW